MALDSRFVDGTRFGKDRECLLYALKDNEYCLSSYKGNHFRSMTTVEELLEWYDNVGRKL